MTHISDLPEKHPDPSTGWQNWSGSLPKSSAQIHTPDDLDALKALIKQTKTALRPVGAGHSWPPLVPSDTAIIRLDKFAAIGKVDKRTKRGWVGAGARLHDISPALAEQGFAFRNLGDIDVQSLAGATATATHGTGRDLPAISAEITALRLITASGEEIEISATQNPDWLEGARVALGALGIATEIQMQLIPRYRLHRVTYVAKHSELLANADRLWQENRNFEFFYLPFSGMSMAITHNTTDAEITSRPPDDSDETILQIKKLRDRISWWPWLRKRIMASAIGGIKGENVVDDSWRLLPSARNVGFNEMEYHLPLEQGLEALEEMRHYVERKRPDVFFPFEARRTRADNGWLSPFQGADRMSIAVHCYYKDAYDFLFSHIEPIFLRRGGRPHWGKLNSLTHKQARALYPDFERFMALRKELDPKGRFLNPYLRGLLTGD